MKTEHNAASFRVSPEALRKLMDDYSDSGYMNTNGGDIIIDTVHLDEDPDEFVSITGIDPDDISNNSYLICWS